MRSKSNEATAADLTPKWYVEATHDTDELLSRITDIRLIAATVSHYLLTDLDRRHGANYQS